MSSELERMKSMNLIDAVRTEPIENIKAIVKATGIPIDSLWVDYTALNTALECRRKNVAEYLLNENCRINKFTLSTEAASTPLHNAVIFGDKDLVIELLKRGASIEAVDAQFNTPLHLAFIRKEEQMMDDILGMIQKKEDYTNRKNGKGLSHMHIACTRKNSKVINGFIKTNVNIEHSVREDCQSWAGYTALHFAAKFRSSIAVKLLLEAGAINKTKNIYGQTPVQLANEDFVESSIIVDSLSTDSNNCCHTMSHFHLVCLKDDPSTLKNFIKKGANVHVPVHESSTFCPYYTPLHFAVLGNCQENVKLLLSHKVDDACFNEFYQTPLHLSLYKDNPLITKMLYDDKTHLENMKDCNGLNYLDVAVSRNDVNQINQFLNEGQDVNKCVTYEKQRFYHYTPLHFAVLYNRLEAAQVLVDRGADINASDGARHGTPLHLALKLRHQNLIEFLLAKKADVQALRPYDNATAIHVLVESYACLDVLQKINDESLKYVERLVNLGVDVNAKTIANGTALHFACLYNDAKCAKLLLEFGADVNIANKSGKTPFDCCVPINDKALCSDAGDLVEVLYHHVQKLKALGMVVNEKNDNCCRKLMEMKDQWYPERFRHEVLKNMEDQRLDEIAKMEGMKLTIWTTLKDFLILHAKRAAPYLGIETLKNLVEVDDLMREFPGYGYLIKLRYEQAVLRQTKRKAEESRFKDVGLQTDEIEIEEIPIKKQRPEL